MSTTSQLTERRKWSQAEDNQLIKLIKKYGTKNWRVVASQLKERTPKQCRERWINHLDPAIIKGKLTEEEWNIVLESQEELGNRWSEIAKLLPGRTPNQIKNVWHAMMRRESKYRKLPKRKFSSLVATGTEEDGNSSGEEEVSESEDWDSPIIKRRKLDNSSPILSPRMNAREIDEPTRQPTSRLDALLEIASDMYEMEVEASPEFQNAENEEDVDNSQDPNEQVSDNSQEYDQHEEGRVAASYPPNENVMRHTQQRPLAHTTQALRNPSRTFRGSLQEIVRLQSNPHPKMYQPPEIPYQTVNTNLTTDSSNVLTKRTLLTPKPEPQLRSLGTTETLDTMTNLQPSVSNWRPVEV